MYDDASTNDDLFFNFTMLKVVGTDQTKLIFPVFIQHHNERK